MEEMPKKVLIAEDEQDVVDILKAGLSRNGYEVMVAFDGEQAKIKIEEEKPDVILLDIMMPVVNGWEVLRWMRLEKKLSTPTIIVSAKNEMQDIKKGYSLEADYYIMKPVRMSDVLKGIATLLTFQPKQEP